MRQKVSVATHLTFSLAKTKHALGIRMPPFSFGDSDMTDQRKGSDAEPTTHFGFKNVPESQKAEKVAEVFHSVAAKYDLMNDVLSGGMHRLWKRFTPWRRNTSIRPISALYNSQPEVTKPPSLLLSE